MLASEWAELVRQFTQQLTRAIARKGKKALWVGCTEIQPRRLQKYQQVAPHLHLVYVAHSGDYRWYVSANEIRTIWKRILEARLKHWLPDENHSVDTRAAVDIQPVKKSAESYLAKYLTKGEGVIAAIKEIGWEDCIPSAWWHCCDRLKKAVRSGTREVPSDIKKAVRQGVNLVARGVMAYLFEIERDDRRFGWVGKLAPEWITPVGSDTLSLICDTA
jgi:hypothetical protein